ncbi:leucyl-tRNA synthetase [Mangrovimonas yunxiaonensis]|uniref:Leucine--tRNA ligase n=1 Tax=Mangrovimonas yunxiaonensis TaxID=1197477 RepID=A0A084TLF3_9FLAO|nr:leucine--tRNA ligase [Mangrovimonas yunxiaonensis]KFB01539.1 leucyl-tRNA synthetase [Mangrovimonas yunxiaonensis]GGH36098.1 leucine--tRNA ligase [Mangrovimonas yunxiaonensis]
MTYHFNDIEAKWQEYWAKNQTFKAENKSDKPKYYVLDMFPYPSGAGLHVGHPLGYIASDIYARYKRHKGFNVLHPQGYDSFGLPAEQYAIQTGQHPAVTTETNIATYRKQLDKIGFSFDWSREVRTSSPEYYKWTQWIFIQLFESYYCNDANAARPISELIEVFAAEGNATINAACDDDVEIFSAEDWNNFSSEKQQDILLQYRLTYLAETEVNWCPALGTVLANDEIVNGVSERGGHPVIRKKMTQWSMRISAYAERLLQGLDTIDWTDSLKESQRNWIGKSVGASVSFNVIACEAKQSHQIEVFTTRPDTIFGVSFMTLAPEHDLVQKITTPEQKAEVDAYIEATAKRSERDRMADVKTISGVFTGAYAEHPFTKEPVPIWIGDYVLASYGTGAVMAVPCGDQRDYDFAKHFNIDIPNIFEGVDISEEAFADKNNTIIANSDFLNGMNSKKATKRAIYELEQIGQGQGKTNYRLRDAVFSRQRYWGEPFPVYYVNGKPQMIAEEYLPITLPEVEKYLPTETGEPPLGRADVWAWDTKTNTVCHSELVSESDGVYPLELNTMPGWAGSSWYFFRYMEEQAKRGEAFATEDALKYWENVDLYIGGSEHATGHLLYARFWTKFLKDRGFVGVDEPFKKLINQGMILGTSAIVYRVSGENKYVSKGLKADYDVDELRIDVNLVNASDEVDVEGLKVWQPQFEDAEFILEEGKYIVGREVEKMSKRWFNVVNPDSICEQYGADSLRLYEMFLGPLEQAKPWNTAGITGVHGFLKKLWKLFYDNNTLKVTETEPTKDNLKTLHKTIKKVEEDIENFSFNTSVSTFMIAVNELTAQKCTSKTILEQLLVLISPYAPHIAEELWETLGNNESIATAPFPEFNEKHLVESSKEYPISFNGKMRFKLELPLDLSKEAIEKAVLEHEKTQEQLQGRTPKKVIVVPGKIVNVVG